MAGATRILLSSVAAIALSSAAFAADMPIRAPQAVYTKAAPAAWSWEGQYIGVHGGYAWGTNDIHIGGVNGELSPSGGFAGFQLGYNYHLNRNWVLGYEVDVSFADVNDSAVVNVLTSNSIHTLGTARARLGYAQGPVLLYATGGLAWATTKLSNPAGIFTLDRPQVGYAVGAGVEYAFAQNWSAKIEYLYMNLGDTNSTLIATNFNTDLTMSTVRVGLNYRFANWRAPVANDIPTKAPVRVAGWTGPYIGVHAGYGWGNFDTTVGGVPASLEPSGGLFGIQSGYNWQLSNNIVVGIEADSSWGRLRDTAAGNSVDIDATGTVRARLGYAMNNMLFYGTGGLAWAHADSATLLQVRDQFYIGWAGGVGLEYAFAPRWSAKIEYLYADYGKINDFFGTTLSAAPEVQTIKVGLNYRAGILDLLGVRWQ